MQPGHQAGLDRLPERHGPITRVIGAGDVYDFSIASGTGAVITVAPGGPGFVTNVIYGTQAELGTFSFNTGCRAPAGKTINASVGGTGGQSDGQLDQRLREHGGRGMHRGGDAQECAAEREHVAQLRSNAGSPGSDLRRHQPPGGATGAPLWSREATRV